MNTPVKHGSTPITVKYNLVPSPSGEEPFQALNKNKNTDKNNWDHPTQAPTQHTQHSNSNNGDDNKNDSGDPPTSFKRNRIMGTPDTIESSILNLSLSLSTAGNSPPRKLSEKSIFASIGMNSSIRKKSELGPRSPKEYSPVRRGSGKVPWNSSFGSSNDDIPAGNQLARSMEKIITGTYE